MVNLVFTLKLAKVLYYYACFPIPYFKYLLIFIEDGLALVFFWNVFIFCATISFIIIIQHGLAIISHFTASKYTTVIVCLQFKIISYLEVKFNLNFYIILPGNILSLQWESCTEWNLWDEAVPTCFDSNARMWSSLLLCYLFIH